jgi:hypothetical protein
MSSSFRRFSTTKADVLEAASVRLAFFDQPADRK